MPKNLIYKTAMKINLEQTAERIESSKKNFADISENYLSAKKCESPFLSPNPIKPSAAPFSYPKQKRKINNLPFLF